MRAGERQRLQLQTNLERDQRESHDGLPDGRRQRQEKAWCIVGYLPGVCLELAKDVDASRLTFGPPPAFDPVPFMDEITAAAYVDPAILRGSGAKEPGPLPHVRVRGSKKAQLDLYRRLDATGRLVLIPAHELQAEDACGLFDIVKNECRDRLLA